MAYTPITDAEVAPKALVTSSLLTRLRDNEDYLKDNLEALEDVVDDIVDSLLSPAGCWLASTGESWGSGSVPVTITWQTEKRDTDGFHSPSSKYIVIPSAFDARKGKLRCNFDVTNTGGVSSTLQVTIISSTQGVLSTFYYPSLSASAKIIDYIETPVITLSTSEQFSVVVTGSALNGSFGTSNFFELQVI